MRRALFLAATLAPLAWAYMLGSTLGALVLAAIAYRVALTAVLAHRAGDFGQSQLRRSPGSTRGSGSSCPISASRSRRGSAGPWRLGGALRGFGGRWFNRRALAGLLGEELRKYLDKSLSR